MLWLVVPLLFRVAPTFQGTVVEAHTAGQLGGKGELKLQLTSVTFGGRTYPIATDFWWHQGLDKTGNTVGNTIGLASVGALIGAVAGGGVGAAVGAGIGGVAGLGVSSASGKGEAAIPAGGHRDLPSHSACGRYDGVSN